MAEYVNSMHLCFQVDTNKKTVQIDQEVENIDEAIDLLKELRDDLADQ